jgi:iron complex transport system ATP-binding protein
MQIDIEDLCFHYPKNPRPAISGISLHISPGKLLYLIGPNGSGKSTLLRCIGGLLSPASGAVKVGGTPVSSISRKSRARLMGFVPQQEIPVFAFTVRDVVVTGRISHHGIFGVPSSEDYSMAEEAIHDVGISHLSDRLCTEISGGEWQLVMIARALAQDPRILLLDEPTSHLDLANQMKVITVIHNLVKRGYTCILVSHNPDQVFLIEGSVAVMKEGTIAYSGLPSEVITAGIMQEMYGIQVLVAGRDNGLERGICVPLLPDEK